MKLSRYKQNLSIIDNYVISYATKVARIDGDKLVKLDWRVGYMTSSPTTSKHINFVAGELGLTIQ
jgi:hypothetical protein